MKISIRVVAHQLKFKNLARTSRGTMLDRPVYFLFCRAGDQIGIGECAPMYGLSIETQEEVTEALEALEGDYSSSEFYHLSSNIASVQFTLEMAKQDLKHSETGLLFANNFSLGQASIPINGLIWMGDMTYMKEQISTKLASGQHCLKLKIGANDFEEEIQLLTSLRKEFTSDELEIRVDANGAFAPTDALEKLNRLAALSLHSIEQPIRQGQWDTMAHLCRNTALPIALDEELIGVNDELEKVKLLDAIQPHYIILKPSLVGGFEASEEWMALAAKRNIGYWITSALESNVGLSAIAQWTYELGLKNHQGLGTGKLFENNIPSPLEEHAGRLCYNPERKWDYKNILA